MTHPSPVEIARSVKDLLQEKDVPPGDTIEIKLSLDERCWINFDPQEGISIELLYHDPRVSLKRYLLTYSKKGGWEYVPLKDPYPDFVNVVDRIIRALNSGAIIRRI